MCKSDNGNGSNVQNVIVIPREGEDDQGDELSTPVGAEGAAATKAGYHYIIQEPTIGEKLFQAKEDRLFLHKILGFSALASYVYRFGQMGDRDGGFSGIMPLVFVLHHASLNVTSFVFEIPQRRIKGGFRIWPEYRIHSMVFAFRSLACILRLWMLYSITSTTSHNNNGILYSMLDNGFANWAIVMATCAAADYGSSLSRHYKSDTVRGTEYFDPYANWFASEMQFHLTAVCLSGGYQRYSLHIVAAFIIQFNSFLMTLRRKNVFSHLALTTTYGLMLLGAMFMATWEDWFTNDQVTRVAVFGNLAVILRMGMGIDKYWVWTLMAIGMHSANQYLPVYMESLPRDPSFYWTIAFWITKFVCYGLGVRKRAKAVANRQLQETKDKTSKEAPAKAGHQVVLTAFCVFSVMATFDMLDIFEII